MKSNIVKSLLAVTVAVLFCAGAASAAMYHVDLDLASLGVDLSSVTDLELEIQLYDNNGSIGDSWAHLDNVVLDPETIDFQDGSLGGFDDDYDPSTTPVGVSVVDLGSGNLALRMDEDPSVSSILVFRDFFGFTGSVLSFDVEAELGTGSVAASLPDDQLVFSLLDPWTLSPLGAGFSPGLGDVVFIDSGGVNVVPVPAALLLGLLGFGSAGLGLRTRLARSR